MLLVSSVLIENCDRVARGRPQEEGDNETRQYYSLRHRRSLATYPNNRSIELHLPAEIQKGTMTTE